MARKKSASQQSVRHLEMLDELRIFMNDEFVEGVGKVMPQMASGRIKILAKFVDNAITEQGDLWAAYANAPTDKEGLKWQEKMAQHQEKLLDTLLTLPDGWSWADVAEQCGAKVNWSKIPFEAIDSTDCVDLLATKKFNFEAKRTIQGKQVDFADYLNSGVYTEEKNTIESYNRVVETIKERNLLIRTAKALQKEKDNPETSAQRLQQIEQQLLLTNERFNEIRQQLPQMCDTVNANMFQYYLNANILKYACDKKYFSAGKIKQINLENLKESMQNMDARSTLMQRINATFNSQTNNQMQNGESAIAFETFDLPSRGLGTLATAQNSMPIREKPAVVLEMTENTTAIADAQKHGSTLANNAQELPDPQNIAQTRNTTAHQGQNA